MIRLKGLSSPSALQTNRENCEAWHWWGDPLPRRVRTVGRSKWSGLLPMDALTLVRLFTAERNGSASSWDTGEF